jgi:hypothetical protein
MDPIIVIQVNIAQPAGGGFEGNNRIFVGHLNMANIEEQIKIGVAHFLEKIQGGGRCRQRPAGEMLDAKFETQSFGVICGLSQGFGIPGQGFPARVQAGDHISGACASFSPMLQGLLDMGQGLPGSVCLPAIQRDSFWQAKRGSNTGDLQTQFLGFVPGRGTPKLCGPDVNDPKTGFGQANQRLFLRPGQRPDTA